MTNSIRALSLEDPRTRVSGRGSSSSDDDYDAARVMTTGAVNARRAAIVRVEDAQDVARVIALARETGAELAVHAGAHSAAGQRGYASIGDLRMYYEIYGSGDTPLLLLHGGLFNIDLQFGELIPGLAARRRVIAADFQGHGRTNDIDRSLRTEDLASDVVGLLDHLGVTTADVFGFSIGGAVALYLAIRHPDRVRKLVVSSVSFHPDGDRTENAEALGAMTVDMIAGTPMEQDYVAKSPHPERLQELLDKLGVYDEGAAGWSQDDIRGIGAATLITVGDCDAVKLDHAVHFLQLRGGDVNGDVVGVPASQLAVFPGTTHFFGLARTALVLDVVNTFIDAPAHEDGA